MKNNFVTKNDFKIVFLTVIGVIVAGLVLNYGASKVALLNTAKTGLN